MPEQIAAIDLGSNSFHMIVGRLDEGRLVVLDKMRERVRLGAGLDADGNLTDDAQSRALYCLERFGQRVRDIDVGHVRAVGTNTLRKAKNGAEFVIKAQSALQHPIEIIAGREEARLIYLGVAQTVSGQRRRLVVDIGGGSTEVIIGDGFEIIEADSLFMGCVEYSQRHFGDGVLSAERFETAEIAAQLELQSIASHYNKVGWDATLGCSGTIHAIRSIVITNEWSPAGITRKSLKRLKKTLITQGTTSQLNLPGLEEDRKPVIAGGTAILKAVFDALHIDVMRASSGALREGLLYDLVGRIQHEDVRDRTIAGLQEQHRVDLAHAQRVERTALELLEQAFRPWNLAEERSRQLLSWAADLHEIGTSISHTGYHRHSGYIVENADMAGFSRDDQHALAAIVQSHRRKLHMEPFQLLHPETFEQVVRLTLLFRLAVKLNRSRTDVERPVVALRIKKKQPHLVVAFPNGWLDEHPLTRTDLLNEAKYAQALGYDLTVREVD